MLDYSKSFIETQFPVSKISKESYKERKAGASQTLTGLGKWWGRKPLVLVRAALLGVLLPVSDDQVKDRELFLKIMTMDNDGLFLRKTKNLTKKQLWELLTPSEKAKFFKKSSTAKKPRYIKGISSEEKEYLQKLAFDRLSYDDKLRYCDRPEHVDNLPEKAWKEINEHLGTNASSLQELTRELGEKRYGHTPKVGDCFSGGGSIPFEAARMGADIYGSDLNPIAALLTWASLNILGVDSEKKKGLTELQSDIINHLNDIVTAWGIEHDASGARANSYLYCSEVICPECGYKVPLATSWVIGKGSKAAALLKDNGRDGFDIEVVQKATRRVLDGTNDYVTIRGSNIFCPHCERETPISSLRGDRKDANGNKVYGLRKWKKHEFMPYKDDIFQERLYAIRWDREYFDKKGQVKTDRYYAAPTNEDLQRERKVVSILSEVFSKWQEEGYIPTTMIEEGNETSRLTRERGWQYWHQLFNPRQLLLLGLINKAIDERCATDIAKVTITLSLSKFADWNSKLSVWNSTAGGEKVSNTFTNQALNTLFNYGTRAFSTLYSGTIWFFNFPDSHIIGDSDVEAKDARQIDKESDIWITDPPYADAVNYHELTEFFLAWGEQLIHTVFPQWYADSKRALAVKGTGQSFNNSMIEIYRNLANHMPENGTQIVMFTHQDVKVWSELAMILWSAGLRVVSAWNIATETESGGLKSGNYVKGTVLLTLKKQISNDEVFQDELYDEIQHEVRTIIDSMRDLDDKDDPDFTDADYLLASYAASLKVLTTYKKIVGIDVDYWLSQATDSDKENPIERLIKKAQKIAYDYLIPEGFDKHIWKDLTAEERFFARGLELEMNSVYKVSAYQELARGFGVSDYADLFASFKANSARFMTPSEFKMKQLGGEGFSSSLLRHLLVAINEVGKEGSTIKGLSYLKSIYQQDNAYWYKKPMIVQLLNFITRIEHLDHMEHWQDHAYHAKILREAVRNDGV